MKNGRIKVQGKMGGGQMKKPMMAKTGKLIGKQKNLPKHLQEKILA